jgi:hypothetical protein
MDLFIRVLMVLPFGWSQFEALGIGTNIDLLENRVCSGLHFYYLFVKFTHHERIKTNNRCCFIYLQPVFATVFAIGLGKDELNLVKILSAILIFVGVYL